MRLFLRAFVLTILRFLVIMSAILAMQNFDFNPLPGWLVVLFAYVLQFLITYFFALWVFRGRTPTTRQIALVAVVFILFETFWEALLYLFVSQGTWSDLLANYRWQSLYVVAVYAVAVALAGYRTRRKRIKASLPEGLEA